MASTGEVGCFGDDGDEALLQALAATGFRPHRRGVLLSLGPKSEYLPSLVTLTLHGSV
jgi:carbamoyl-phosphate synthase large subunit